VRQFIFKMDLCNEITYSINTLLINKHAYSNNYLVFSYINIFIITTFDYTIKYF
jgi:hypothetical protein